MYCFSPLDTLDSLDGLHHGSTSILPAHLYVHGSSDRTRCVDPGPPGFIGEADKMRVGKIIFNFRQARSKPVLQLQIGGGIGNHTACQHHHIGPDGHTFIQQGSANHNFHCITPV